MSDREFGGNDDLSLPKATVHKIITEILPQLSPASDPMASLTFTREARDLLTSCSVEFIRMLSSESNEISEKEAKKTIAVEHIQSALRELGFGDFCADVGREAGEFKEIQKHREKRVNKMETSGLSDAELARMQEEMFKSAREKFDSQGVAE